MAILDIFKKKKPAESPQERTIRRTRQNVELLAGKKMVKKEAPVAVQPKPKKILGEAYRILKKIRVAEKATDLISKNQYVFEVFSDSNKNQIKKAVEDVYGVDVVAVNIVKITRKKRRLGKISGWRSGGKKAVVKLKEGQKIEVLPR